MTARARWWQAFRLGDRVEVRTWLDGREIWRLGTVSELPRPPRLDGTTRGTFRVQRDPVEANTHGGLVEVRRSVDVRRPTPPAKPPTQAEICAAAIARGHVPVFCGASAECTRCGAYAGTLASAERLTAHACGVSS